METPETAPLGGFYSTSNPNPNPNPNPKPNPSPNPNPNPNHPTRRLLLDGPQHGLQLLAPAAWRREGEDPHGDLPDGADDAPRFASDHVPDRRRRRWAALPLPGV